jgi:hypothetical protein
MILKSQFFEKASLCFWVINIVKDDSGNDESEDDESTIVDDEEQDIGTPIYKPTNIFLKISIIVLIQYSTFMYTIL